MQAVNFITHYRGIKPQLLCFFIKDLTNPLKFAHSHINQSALDDQQPWFGNFLNSSL